LLAHGGASFAIERRAAVSFVVIIVVVTGTEPTGLRVHFHLAGLTVFRTGRFQVSTVATDLYVRPAVRLQLLPNLVFGHRLISSNEDWTFGWFSHHHRETDASD
jgi:hypothetical protein